MSYESKYFSRDEMECHHCYELPPNGMNDKLLEKLDQLRELAGNPIYATCMYRCPEHNADVGGVPNSQHVDGTGADIFCNELSVDELADLAVQVGFDGIGRYYEQQFVHVDCRDNGQNPNYYTWVG